MRARSHSHRVVPPVPCRPQPLAPGDAAVLGPIALFAELDRFVTACDVTTADPGQVVQAQDVPVRWWHVVLSGHAVVRRDGTPLGLLTSGDSWSEHSLLNGLRSSIEVVALSPLTLVTLDRRRFFNVPERHPVLAGRLVARSAASPDRLALPVLRALASFGQADPA